MLNWIFSNLMIPIIVPTLCVAVLKICNPKISIKKTLRDGQLGWVAVCFAASAKYELKQIRPEPEWFVLADWFTLSFIGLTSLLTAYATVHPFDENEENFKGWFNKYRVLIATGGATLLSAILYGVIHFSLESPGK